jgi:2-polyprenyl-3-methyl-5-hydroxy-6-metoxy-1,4-benzoquinol methylase
VVTWFFALRRLALRVLGDRQKKWLKKMLKRVAARGNANALGIVLNSQGRQVKYLNNVHDLDLELKKVDQAFAISDDEGRKALGTFEYVFNNNLPNNPYSTEYYAAQMRLYTLLSGRDSYLPERDENTEFNMEQTEEMPFPYSTQSPLTVGDQLIAQGFLIRTLDLAPKAQVVEFGAGWGSLTLHLVQMGYHVTVIEINQSFLDLLRFRLDQLHKEAILVNKNMLDFAPTERYDAAIFFEAFHHCSDHLRLLQNLHSIVTDEGIVAFAGEPILDFPFPWGLRHDGMAVWSTRKFGWLELGFNTSYFLRTLLLLGWLPKRHQSSLGQWSDVIIARKSKLVYTPSDLTLPPDEDETWAPRETAHDLKIRFSGKESLLSCSKEVDARQVEFCLSNYAPFDLKVTLCGGSSSETVTVPRHSLERLYRISVRDWQGNVSIHSPTWKPSRLLKNNDPRELGVAVNHVRIIVQSAG